MTLRKLGLEFRAYPATFCFCIVWTAIFAAMTGAELAAHNPFMTPARWLLLGFGGGDRFGDLTLEDLERGQVWRLLTCTFVHYSLLHVGLNVLAMYQIGTMVESWYGSPQLIFIYGLTGGAGNLVSVLIRHEIGSGRAVHSAGGSVVILGLVGMCAVVGWRSKHPTGRYLGRQMGTVLILTAVVGALLPRFFDNWGHAGGALVGGAMGLGHRRLLASRSKPSAWGAGVVTGLIVAGCGAAQLIEDRREAPARLEKRLVRRSDLLAKVEWDLNVMARVARAGGDLAKVPQLLDSYERLLDGPVRERVHGLRPLFEAARAHRLTDAERQQLKERVAGVVREVRREHQIQQNELRRLRDRRR